MQTLAALPKLIAKLFSAPQPKKAPTKDAIGWGLVLTPTQRRYIRSNQF